MAQEYNKRPSEIMYIEDHYTAFCFDEACFYITTQLRDKKRPKWIDRVKEKLNNNSELFEMLK